MPPDIRVLHLTAGVFDRDPSRTRDFSHGVRSKVAVKTRDLLPLYVGSWSV